MSKITNDGLTRSGTARMLYSFIYMATVGVKGLIQYETHSYKRCENLQHTGVSSDSDT